MKEQYTVLKMQILEFEDEDVITASPSGIGEDGGDNED